MGVKRILTIAVVGSAVFASVAVAQQDLNINEGEGVPVGPFIFSPAVGLTWESEDNIFLSPENEESDQIYSIAAKLQFELPVRESYLRFTYTPRYHEYADYELNENMAHYVDVDGLFEFASGWQLKTAYRFVDGNLDVRQIDPGGELTFGDRQFTKHDLSLVADYWVTARDGVTVQAGYTDLANDEELFYDYDRSYLGIGWLHQLSETLTMDVQYRYLTFGASETFAYRDYDANELTVGFNGLISPVLRSEVRLGYRSTSYDTAAGAPDFDDFSGLVAEGSLAWEMAHGSTVAISVNRSEYPSNFGSNAYYVATGGGLTYRYSQGRFFASARARVQTNDYELTVPGLTESRDDDLTLYGLGAGYRFSPLLSLRASYTYRERDSLEPFSYESNTFLIGLVFGY
jgi:hypothetical protein